MDQVVSHRGLTVEVEGDEVVIRFKKSANLGLSASKKSVVIATTSGNVDIGDGVKVGVNAYRAAEQ